MSRFKRMMARCVERHRAVTETGSIRLAMVYAQMNIDDIRRYNGEPPPDPGIDLSVLYNEESP